MDISPHNSACQGDLCALLLNLFFLLLKIQSPFLSIPPPSPLAYWYISRIIWLLTLRWCKEQSLMSSTQVAALQIKQPIINLLSRPSVGRIYVILTFKTTVNVAFTGVCEVHVEVTLKKHVWIFFHYCLYLPVSHPFCVDSGWCNSTQHLHLAQDCTGWRKKKNVWSKTRGTKSLLAKGSLIIAAGCTCARPVESCSIRRVLIPGFSRAEELAFALFLIWTCACHDVRKSAGIFRSACGEQQWVAGH